MDTFRDRAGPNPKPSVADVLSDCCSTRTPVIILNVENRMAYYHARLGRVSGHGVALELYSQPLEPFPIGAQCCVSFNYRGGCRAFFSTVLQYRHAPQMTTLILQTPSQFVGIESRAAFRVKVMPTSGLSVRLTSENGRVWPAQPVDLSAAGILVEVDNNGDPQLAVGAECWVELQLPPNVVRAKGEIRRHAGKQQLGISFTGATKGFNPPQALKEIVLAVERDWLNTRMG